ncbi:MAG: AAA family ATPase, partial [Chloroflexota bacterium]|nr:AAA family ATPase [Chloroflexota bacterium]
MHKLIKHAGVNPLAPPSATLQIYTLGTLQVVREAKAVTESDWHTRQARQLLKILITERPRPVATDRLIEILWPESTPKAAATTLRSAINALRNVLEPTRRNRAPSSYVVTETPGYAFCEHPAIWLDVDAFEAALNAVEGAHDGAIRRPLLAGAIDLYKDDYLISDPYADWVQHERERLRERFFGALLQLAELQATAGEYASAISNCRRVLARDEVRENAYQALMRYQAESGDSAGALLTYERCRAILSEELGADPSPLTQQWHQRILNGEIEAPPAPAAMLSAVEPLHPLSTTVPLPQRTLLPALDEYFLSIFVGREHETAQLDERLHAALTGKGNLVLLEGEAGVGKTRLAYATLQAAVRAGATVISTAGQPLERQLPFAVLADGLGRYLHALPDAALAGLPAASLAQLAQIVPSLQDRLPTLPIWIQETTARSAENRQRLIDGIVAFVAALARARPLLFFLDDLHWADADTLAVLGRLAQRLVDLPLLLLLAYRSEDLAENEALNTLLHGLHRLHGGQSVTLGRFNPQQVQDFVQRLTGWHDPSSAALAAQLYSATGGNALFVSEALRDWQERQTAAPGVDGAATLESIQAHPVWPLYHNGRVQEIILERIERLPAAARAVLQVGAVIGRDFSLELLESAITDDPMHGLEILLQRKFWLERQDERLDFSHQVVRQVAYERMTTLQRRRLHVRVADALVGLGRAGSIPGEIAFHYGQAGGGARAPFAHYSVLAGEKLLRTYGFRQAVENFDEALSVLEATSASPPELIRRALQGRGLAHEALFDPDGVTDTYRRLQAWAQGQGDQPLMLKANSRLTSMLGLLGQQRESNDLLRQLIEALAPGDGARLRSQVILDLFARRQLIYSPDAPQDENEWAAYTPPPPAVIDPLRDLSQLLDPVHAVLPLLDYGWTLLVQGQPGEATRCLEAVVELAQSTGQPSIASTALHQLAVTARVLGHLEQSQALNEQSVMINRAMQGAAAELGSMWPRIASAFLALRLGQVDEAERRLRRVTQLLDQRAAFRNHRNSANIGLGLVTLAQGNVDAAKQLLTAALADSVNLYPYTHVRALLGLAQI